MFKPKRRFAGRGAGGRPTRTWMSLETTWSTGTLSATTATSLLALQAPTAGGTITSDPPEDMTLLRIIAEHRVIHSAAVAEWVVALTVQDTTWTPSSTFADDADKRILYAKAYANPTATARTHHPPGQTVLDPGGTPAFAGGTERQLCFIDIAPRVRLEPGKALFLVCYEQAGTGTFELDAQFARVLFQRSARRR